MFALHLQIAKFPECPRFKPVFRIAKFHQEAGLSSQYVCLPTILNHKLLLKHETKVVPLKTNNIHLKIAMT